MPARRQGRRNPQRLSRTVLPEQGHAPSRSVSAALEAAVPVRVQLDRSRGGVLIAVPVRHLQQRGHIDVRPDGVGRCAGAVGKTAVGIDLVEPGVRFVSEPFDKTAGAVELADARDFQASPLSGSAILPRALLGQPRLADIPNINIRRRSTTRQKQFDCPRQESDGGCHAESNPCWIHVVTHEL
jgi:hypothetical protein